MKKVVLLLVVVAFSFGSMQDPAEREMKEIRAELKELIEENSLIHYHYKKGWVTMEQKQELLKENMTKQSNALHEMLEMKFEHIAAPSMGKE